MFPHSFSLSRKTVPLAVLLAAILILPAFSISASGQRHLPQAELGLEILFSGDAKTQMRPLVLIGGGSTLIHRPRLRINDPIAAGQLTAVDLHAEIDGNAIKVRLSIIYDDLSNQEWWKDKHEKLAGIYTIQEGESVRAEELAQFGIEPFEMKVITSKMVVLKPGEGPRIVNNTTALEVARLEKHFRDYRLSLKNISSKNVVAFAISAGNIGIGSEGGAFAGTQAVLAAGATSHRDYSLDARQVETSGITIRFAVFEDGTFEGDPKLGAQFSAKTEGVRIQAPHVLRRIEETLRVDDPGLRAAFDKLEAELWQIPEAIDKSSALGLLKNRFSSVDDQTLSELYEGLKSGLYDARNIALASLGSNRQVLRDRAQYDDSAATAQSLRGILEDLKQTFERITSIPR